MIFSNQVKELPSDLVTRRSFMIEKIEASIENFEKIKRQNVFLDSDSDGSHLVSWHNAISIFNAEIS